MKALIVSNEKMLRETTRTSLLQLGYACRTAAHGREALEILERDSIPVALVDSVMLEMDGMALVKEIIKRYPNTDILVMTDRDIDCAITDIIRQGAVDSINKPFSTAELEIRLARIFRERQRRSEIIAGRNKCSAIFDGRGDGIQVVAVDYAIVFLDKACAEKNGLSFDERIGMRCYELLFNRKTPCEDSGFICPVRECRATGLPVRTTLEFSFEHGEVCFMEADGIPLMNGNQRVDKVIVIYRHIGKLAEHEETLKRKEAQLKVVLDSVLTGIVIVDAEDHRITYANKVAREMIGAPEEEIGGNVCHKYMCPAEEGKCPVTDSGKQVQNDVDGVLLNAAGKKVDILKSVLPVTLEGRKYLIESFFDITERKRQREELVKTKEFVESIMNHSPDYIIVGDATGHLVRINKPFLERLGWKEEDLIGKHAMNLSVMEEGIYETTAGDTLAVTREFIQSAYTMLDRLLENKGVLSWQNYYKRKDNVLIPAETSTVLLYDSRGNISGSLGISRDITERRKAELENARLLKETQEALTALERTQSQLLQSDKMASVGQLAAGVAHEINNPIGFIHSNLGSLNKYSARLLELMRKYEEGMEKFKHNGHGDIAPFCEEIAELKERLKIDYIIEDFQKVITDSLEGTERIRKIVADLKNFSRVDQSEFNDADIHEGLESTLNVVWNELKYKCTIEKDYGDLPSVYCNLGQLNQVFANLLVNAAQAIEGKGVIRIATRYHGDASNDNGKGQGRVEITISDTGCGIPQDKLGRIFEPFFTTKDVGKGTGLGLSIAYDIVTKKHKGSISVVSEVGKGTAFTITLPLLQGGGNHV